jgi:hypothetical protein
MIDHFSHGENINGAAIWGMLVFFLTICFEAYYKRPNLIMFQRKELHRVPWPMLVLLKAQNCQMFKRKEPMLALHTVQGHPSTQRSIYANKKKSEDQSVVAHFMLADCKSHYSGITGAVCQSCRVWGICMWCHVVRWCDPHVQALCLGFRVRWCDETHMVVLLCKQEQCVSNVAKCQHKHRK